MGRTQQIEDSIIHKCKGKEMSYSKSRPQSSHQVAFTGTGKRRVAIPIDASYQIEDHVPRPIERRPAAPERH
jgi:hypothetical protein